ncbi:hypothetical protein AN219_16570 [Streptomyces nanshensis]|nr:hypothetical protein AN219_16570 [Streptomyces nanshensis]
MSLVGKLNRKLGSVTGYEVRRAGRPRPVRPAEPRPETATTAKGKQDRVDFRAPDDPAVDRLLKRPVFVIAPVRSGSTLLRLLLGAHSQLHSPHELHVRRLEVRSSTGLGERSMAALGLERGDLEHLLWDRVMHRELVRAGKSTIVEKTPSNAFAYQRIAACWPDARFVFLLRHPASVAESWHEADPDKRNPEEAALDALRYMRAVERARRNLPGHVVRYEDLTADPEATLKGICAFLDVPFEPGMLEYGAGAGSDLHNLQKGLGDWKEKIRTGHVQQGRDLPGPDEIPEPLREISRAWGYSGAGSGRAARDAGGQQAGKGHAEVAEVWPREGRIRLVGHAHGLPEPEAGTEAETQPETEQGAEPAPETEAAGGPWRLLLTLRGHKDRRLEYPVAMEGTRFDGSFPVADLAAGELPVPGRWDIHLVSQSAGGEVRLRAGRLLDGIKGKKDIVEFPAQPAGEHDGAPLVQPYYTVKDNLSVECLAPRHEAQSAS